MTVAAFSAPQTDRVAWWFDELQRVAGRLPALSPRARGAVRQVVVSILDEGARDELGAEQADRLNEVLAALTDFPTFV